jgi:N-acetylmuramoyl-L-alanine amidase
MRLRLLVARFVVAGLLVSAGALLPAGVAAAGNDTIASFSLSGSPFAESFAPLPPAVSIRLVLSRRARITLTVYDDSNVATRRLLTSTRMGAGAHSWDWAGRDDNDVRVPNGKYRIELSAQNSLGTVTVGRGVRKGLPKIYPANPRAIVIVVDPGHGGRYPGASYNGVSEKTINLATALDLRDLLERAGVNVVMTRTTDVAVNNPKSDVNGDGLANTYDDIAARNDIANEARADLNIHVHNNAYACRCTRGSQTFTNFSRTWTPEALDLVTFLQHQQLVALDQFSDGTYYPIDRGIKNGNYDYMRPYTIVCPTAQWKSCTPPYLPRPTLMPSVLMESLFLNNDIEFALLQRPDVQVALAASMYLGMADWLNSRPYGIGYELAATPPVSAAGGDPLSYTVRVTNRGNVASHGWTLSLGTVSKVQLYDGSGSYGTEIGEAAIPDGVAPGDSVDVVVHATAPAGRGDWLVKTDVRLADASHLSDAGIVPLQIPLTTTIGP